MIMAPGSRITILHYLSVSVEQTWAAHLVSDDAENMLSVDLIDYGNMKTKSARTNDVA